MANEIVTHCFKTEGFSVSSVLIEGDPWFVAMDVAEILEYSDAEAMTRKLDDDEIQNLQIVGFGNRGVNLINESGLYSAILGSRKPEAKKFKKWVTSEVLPAIRKTGQFGNSSSVLNIEQTACVKTLLEEARFGYFLNEKLLKSEMAETIKAKAKRFERECGRNNQDQVRMLMWRWCDQTKGDSIEAFKSDNYPYAYVYSGTLHNKYAKKITDFKELLNPLMSNAQINYLPHSEMPKKLEVVK